MEAKLAQLAYRVLLLLANNGKGKKDDGTKLLLYAVGGVLLTLFLLIGLIVYVITTPFEQEGMLGELQHLCGSYYQKETGGGTEYDDTTILGVADRVPEGKRQAVVDAALELVGEVPYFWGGKSPPGWNEDWGLPRLVTSPGSTTTGSLRPYGLDCSGFVAWVYETAEVSDALQGGGTAYQWGVTDPVGSGEPLPGDLAFKQEPHEKGVNHVGIYLGQSPEGDPIYIHCSAGGGGVVIDSYSGFRHFRRLAEIDVEEEFDETDLLPFLTG